MLFRKKTQLIDVNWTNQDAWGLDRGKWIITTYYFLFIPFYRKYEQESFYRAV